MIYQDINEYLYTMYTELTTDKFSKSDVLIKKYYNNYFIDFKFSKKYYGGIYPMSEVKRDKEFCKKYDILYLINFDIVFKKKIVKNFDVCESCKKIKFYPNIFLMTLYSKIDDFKRFTKHDKIMYVFCKHHSMIDFLEFDYIMKNSETSSISSSSEILE